MQYLTVRNIALTGVIIIIVLSLTLVAANMQPPTNEGEIFIVCARHDTGALRLVANGSPSCDSTIEVTLIIDTKHIEVR